MCLCHGFESFTAMLQVTVPQLVLQVTVPRLFAASDCALTCAASDCVSTCVDLKAFLPNVLDLIVFS